MSFRFGVERWAAFAPGLDSEQVWRDWAKSPSLPHGDEVPALEEMPAMQRRRVDRLGRMALQVAWRCQPTPSPDESLVFASRHGDLARTHEMLQELARSEPLSPTQFGLSTHNAIAAQYSIARHCTGNYSAVSAGRETAECAVVEACGLLDEGRGAVLVTVYDAPPPDAYAGFLQGQETWFAWCLRLVRPRPDTSAFTLERRSGGSPAAGTLPAALDAFRFVLSDDASWSNPVDDHCWHWSRDAG